ncbi:MAG: ABC transporter ATP-binding protein [Firmicutes bacterium]|nr:ABC transporter ATP-binding protein [Erysipelotrichaceae bacterium]MDD7228204.1 ABC transporter ATP-binding protein [Bacillota bacterium]MDY5998035.1 ABC transporter ATP-binding protein [Erysipelotrichaceae bacterium]
MIQIKNIKKSYQDFLLDCSLTIEKGSVTGIIGKNGAGKSTLYKAILNLINIDSGNILVFNKDIKELDVKDKADIGVVLADSFFSSYLNIKDIRKIMMDSYETFDVTFFDKKVNEFELPVNKAIKSFSFGMKAKLKMLCALSHNAKILLLDEPTLGLDVIARDEILELLREYMAKASDNTIMISSHIASDLESLCDDIYMIDDGKIILHEDTDVLLSNYAILKVDDQTYESIDKNYIYKVKKEDYGYALLTNQKQFYYENYPKIVIQNCSIDDVIYMMIKGK